LHTRTIDFSGDSWTPFSNSGTSSKISNRSKNKSEAHILSNFTRKFSPATKKDESIDLSCEQEWSAESGDDDSGDDCPCDSKCKRTEFNSSQKSGSSFQNFDGQVGSAGRVVTAGRPHEDPTAQEPQDLPPAVQADATLVGAQPPDASSRIVGYQVNPNYLGFPPNDLIVSSFAGRLAWQTSTAANNFEPWKAFLVQVGYHFPIFQHSVPILSPGMSRSEGRLSALQPDGIHRFQEDRSFALESGLQTRQD